MVTLSVPGSPPPPNSQLFFTPTSWATTLPPSRHLPSHTHTFTQNHPSLPLPLPLLADPPLFRCSIFFPIVCGLNIARNIFMFVSRADASSSLRATTHTPPLTHHHISSSFPTSGLLCLHFSHDIRPQRYRKPVSFIQAQVSTPLRSPLSFKSLPLCRLMS